MSKKAIIFFIILIIILLLLISIINNYKKLNLGNNIINQSTDSIKENILNIDSYQANVEIVIKSNKNTNTYEVTQKYHRESNLYKQEIISPENIAGTIFEFDGTNLKIKNTNLNLTKIYNNYNYIGSNELSLSSFIEDYKNDENSKTSEDNENLILETTVKDNNKYRKIKKLYISKNTNLPAKMEIQDNSQNTLVYILYNEIEINKLQKEQIN